MKLLCYSHFVQCSFQLLYTCFFVVVFFNLNYKQGTLTLVKKKKFKKNQLLVMFSESVWECYIDCYVNDSLMNCKCSRVLLQRCDRAFLENPVSLNGL